MIPLRPGVKTAIPDFPPLFPRACRLPGAGILGIFFSPLLDPVLGGRMLLELLRLMLCLKSSGATSIN